MQNKIEIIKIEENNLKSSAGWGVGIGVTLVIVIALVSFVIFFLNNRNRNPETAQQKVVRLKNNLNDIKVQNDKNIAAIKDLDRTRTLNIARQTARNEELRKKQSARRQAAKN